MTTVIIKPTDGCNARCVYCSAAHPGASRTMRPETLRRVFRLFGDVALRSGRARLAFIWHGGEPLLMPPDFWEDVLAAQAETLGSRVVSVENRLQSNLTLLGEELVPVLRRLLGDRGVVGTSADPLPGIRELKGRPDGLYGERWEAGVRRLTEAGVRYGILYVVHRRSLGSLREVYRHFRTRHPGAGLRFNPLYRQGRASGIEVWGDLGITAEEWGGALLELFDEWSRDGRPANVQPFGPWWRLHEGKGWRLSCECSGRCVASHFGVDPEGRVHLCGRSADGGTFRFGDAEALDAETLERHPLRRALENRMAYLRRTACRDCPWWLYCHGGCVNDAVLVAGTPFAPTSFCAGLRAFFDRTFGDSTEVSPCAA